MTLRILQLCHKPPRPAVDGGCIAMDSLTTGLLLEGHHVKVLTLHTHKHPFDPDSLSPEYVAATRIEAVYADTELNLRDAASHIVTGESYHLSRFHVPEMDRAVERVLREELFDVVLLESIFTSSYIPAIRRLSDAEVVLRAHNVEHLLWDEVTSNMPKGPKKWLLGLFQAKLRDEEIRLLGVVDAVAAITERDASWFKEIRANLSGSKQVEVVALPFGLDVENTPHSAMKRAPERVLHLGSMDWTPNVQGVTWLRNEVWPLVRIELPNVELDLAGRHMPDDWVSTPETGVLVLGEVNDAAATYDTPCVVVVPLHAGSGMRIKLAEALAAGRPVVTTSKGMEGMALVDQQHVLVANTEKEMAAALTRLLTDSTFALELGQRGRDWALENLGHRARAKALTGYLSQWVQA
jgi:polysaccharide biosynthesis protein PslH